MREMHPEELIEIEWAQTAFWVEEYLGEGVDPMENVDFYPDPPE
jgi:hypothetical protein